jgi:integrase
MTNLRDRLRGDARTALCWHRPATGQRLYRSHGKRATATVIRAKVALSAVFTYALNNDLLPLGHPSPTRDIKGRGFRAAQLPDRALPIDQVEALLAHARTAPWKNLYLFVLMALTTGARKGELRHLRGRDLVLDGPDPHALVGVRRNEAERAGTKNGDVKILNLSAAVVAEIRRWGVPERDDWLFPSERQPGKPFDMHSSYRALVKRVGSSKTSAYTTCGTPPGRCSPTKAGASRRSLHCWDTVHWQWCRGTHVCSRTRKRGPFASLHCRG